MLSVPNRHRYRRKSDRWVVAVQLDLDTAGFRYHKWGAEQRCKPGDWLVNNDGDVYTVDQASFAQTYRQVGLGTYAKATAVWAKQASEAGSVPTKEGTSHYQAGDYLVSNNADGTDAYCVSAGTFEAMYELDE